MTHQWSPVALSSLLRKGGVFRTWLNGAELAVWRSAGGIVHAWDNRCPHRGMRLHHGFVRGEQLACLYHGWHYGPDGACAYIPAHPDLTPPASICVPVTACTEAGGFVWMGGEDGRVPDVPTGFGVAIRTLHVDAPVERVAAEIGGPFEIVDAEGIDLLIAVQPLEDRAALHVAARDDTDMEEALNAARWAARLRDRCEMKDAAQ